MKIIEQSHKILFPDPDKDEPWSHILTLIEHAGRTCYKSKSKGDPNTFVRSIQDRGHYSVIEHGNITVRFITDRGVTHELVRHRLAAYSQESTRYCDYGGDDVVFIRPVWMNDETTYGEHNYPFGYNQWHEAMQHAEMYYKSLRADGWSPQQARAVLPNSLKTEIVMTANLREWRHVLKLRTSKAAHPQIRELMLPLLYQLTNLLPVVFGDIKEEQPRKVGE